jgi:protein TonB
MGSSDGRGYRRTHQLHDGYRRRNDVFLIALLVSLALHAATILLAPGFRRPAFKMVQTMNVLLMPPAPAPRPPATPAPPEVAPPPPSPPPPQARPEKPVLPQPQPDVTPQNAPEAQSPQLALKPAPVLKSAPIPKPNPEPKIKVAPKPKAEPKPEPKPAPRRPEAPRRHRAAEPPVHRHAAPVTPAPPPATTVSPQPSTPPVTATPPPAPPVDDLLDRYGKHLAQIVAGGQHYPRIAQMRGWQGTVEIEITVTPPGRADRITIQRSSGHQVLDDEALDMVKRALPLPQPPTLLRDHRFTVVVPIVFRLR